MDMDYICGTDEKGNPSYFYGTEGIYFLDDEPKYKPG